MNRSNLWTKEEELVIVSHVRENPNNLTKAFRLSSKELSRTYEAIRYRWYSKIRLENTVFFTLSTTNYLENLKNTDEQSVNKKTTSWDKLKSILRWLIG